MPVSLTYLSEEIFVALVNGKRDAFLSVAGLTGVDSDFFDAAEYVAFREASLQPYGGRAFDGASRVDVVVSIAPQLATAFELKLGTTRLSKSRIDSEWLSDCKPSHSDKRWSGNMMAILDRRFRGPAPEEALTAKVEKVGEVTLTRAWFVVARRPTLKLWRKRKPMFSEHVRLLAFEDVVDAFGGKAAFNARVREMLNIDFYETWIKESEGAG
jgi:hypothetical protein